MADGHGAGGPVNDLKMLIMILIGLWALWYFTGGPASETINDPYIKMPAPVDTGETYGAGSNGTDFLKIGY